MGNESWVNGKVQDGVPSRGWALKQVIATVCTTVHIKAWFSYATIFVFWDLFQVHCPWKMRTHLYSISTNSLHRVTTHAALGFNFTLDWPWIRYYSGTSGLFADCSTANFSVQLQFSLYLCGDFNGTVHLSVVENGRSSSPLIWERSGHWKDSWQEIALPITEILKGWDD